MIKLKNEKVLWRLKWAVPSLSKKAFLIVQLFVRGQKQDVLAILSMITAWEMCFSVKIVNWIRTSVKQTNSMSGWNYWKYVREKLTQKNGKNKS